MLTCTHPDPLNPSHFSRRRRPAGEARVCEPRGPNTSATELAVKKGKAAVIVGAQWGDEGKGKIVDVLSEGFPVVARYAGGHNAGHPGILRGKRFVLQLGPVGGLRAGATGAYPWMATCLSAPAPR